MLQKGPRADPDPDQLHPQHSPQLQHTHHSLIITREGLILTLSILITLPGGIFEYHPVSRDRFAQFPLCREWIRKSCPQGQDFPILSLQRIEHLSSRDEYTVGNSMLVRQHAVQTFAGRQKSITLVIIVHKNEKSIHKIASTYV